MAKKIIRLTESDLARIINRVIQEQSLPIPGQVPQQSGTGKGIECLKNKYKLTQLPESCLSLPKLVGKPFSEIISKGRQCAKDLNKPANEIATCFGVKSPLF